MSFSRQFGDYLIPTTETVKQAMTEGLIVLDTNVLLNAYRFAPKAREELLNVLEKFRERIWIPHQVAFEYHDRRFSVIADHTATYDELLAALKKCEEYVADEMDERIRRLSNRAALAEAEREELLRLRHAALEPLKKKVQKLRDEHGLGAPSAPDPILQRLNNIFTDHVGTPFDGTELNEALTEAQRRIKEQIPPGYKDADKDRAHGDYFIWLQALEETRVRAANYLVFVTGDLKEDWYLRIKGKTVAARPELSNECQKASGARLIMMQTDTFLRNVKQHLRASISAETIRQATELTPRTHASTTPTRDTEQYYVLVAAYHRYLAELQHADMNLERLHREAMLMHSRIDEMRTVFEVSQSSDEETEALRDEVQELEMQLATAQARITDMTRRRHRLAGQVAAIEHMTADIDRRPE